MIINRILPIIFLISLVGCSKTSQNIVDEKDFVLYDIGDADTIYSSDYYFIQDLDVKSNRILFKTINEKASFILLNQNLSYIDLMVYSGEGPNDIVTGTLMKTCADNSENEFVIYDNSGGKIVKISAYPQSDINSIINHDIIEKRSLCFNDTLMIGHQMGSPMQLFISSDNHNNIFCDYYLTISEDIENKLGDKYEYVMSNCFAVNPSKNRLLSFNYFFDCVTTYSLDGRFIRSNKNNNDVTDDCIEIMDNGNYFGYCQPYASEEACYIKMIQYVNNEKYAKFIQKWNYEGELLKTYLLPENVTGGYAINNDSELYCIVSEIKGDDEIFHIVKYQLY